MISRVQALMMMGCGGLNVDGEEEPPTFRAVQTSGGIFFMQVGGTRTVQGPMGLIRES